MHLLMAQPYALVCHAEFKLLDVNAMVIPSALACKKNTQGQAINVEKP